MTCRPVCLLVLLGALAAGWAAPSIGAQPRAASPSWLDSPLENWNRAGAPVPDAIAGGEPRDELRRRCDLAPSRSAAERAVDAAGWMSMRHLDREHVTGDVEIVGGMAGADGMCRPTDFNLFVFVGGRFAGTLSPGTMSSRADGSAGAVRFVEGGISAEFARYTSDDALCCPNARVAVRYRIERSSAGPIVAPIAVRTTRSY